MLRFDRRHFLRGLGLTAGAMTLGGTGLASAASAVESAAVPRALTDANAPFMLARVWLEKSTAHLLAEFDDTHNVFDDGSVEILLWPGDFGRLAASGMRYEITVTDLEA